MNHRRASWVLLWLMLSAAPGAARGAGAEPSGDPAAGSVALGERNCTACHAPNVGQAAWVTPKSAPRLEEIAGRADPAWVRGWIADPAKARPGTTMPNLLAGRPAGERAEAADALTHFLFSQKPRRFDRTHPDKAAAARGERLFHSVGCAACHGPQAGASPATAPVTAPAPAAPFEPLPVMAEKWSFGGLRAFLRDPLAVRPSGRMPSLNLTDAESSDIAHYLLRDVKVPGTLEVAVYEGQFPTLADLDEATPARTKLADGFDPASAHPGDRPVGLRFTSFLRAEQAGEYTFAVTADDAVRLTVGGTAVVTRDGGKRERLNRATLTGRITLAAGWHPLSLDYLHRRDKSDLRVEWQGPGVPRGAIAAGSLRTEKEAVAEPPPLVVDPAKATKGRLLFSELRCAVLPRPSRPRQAAAGRGAGRPELRSRLPGRRPARGGGRLSPGRAAAIRPPRRRRETPH